MGDKFGNRTRALGAGRKPQFEDIERDLIEWIDERRAKGWNVSRDMIKAQALEIFKEKRSENNAEKNLFSASDGWLTKFMQRNGFSLRQKTHQVLSNI